MHASKYTQTDARIGANTHTVSHAYASAGMHDHPVWPYCSFHVEVVEICACKQACSRARFMLRAFILANASPLRLLKLSNTFIPIAALLLSTGTTCQHSVIRRWLRASSFKHCLPFNRLTPRRACPRPRASVVGGAPSGGSVG
eukprot:6194285-Pleurochrysis_carterae.AAC.1